MSRCHQCRGCRRSQGAAGCLSRQVPRPEAPHGDRRPLVGRAIREASFISLKYLQRLFIRIPPRREVPSVPKECEARIARKLQERASSDKDVGISHLSKGLDAPLLDLFDTRTQNIAPHMAQFKIKS